MSKVFDLVDHAILLKIVLDSNLPRALVRWTSNYYSGRTARTMFRDSLSQSGALRQGVPQGRCISPLLFNAYLRDIPMPHGGNLI